MNLKWNVFMENFNGRKIETYDIFRHTSFLDDVRKAAEKCGEDRAAFEEQLRRSLMYYFWSKCEYEIILSSWPGRENFKDKKVDVYDQVNLNWPVFTEYVWQHRDELYPR